jgi:hypothetical protein
MVDQFLKQNLGVHEPDTCKHVHVPLLTVARSLHSRMNRQVRVGHPITHVKILWRDDARGSQLQIGPEIPAHDDARPQRRAITEHASPDPN